MATKRFIGEWTDKDGKRQQTTFHVGNYGGGNLEETALRCSGSMCGRAAMRLVPSSRNPAYGAFVPTVVMTVCPRSFVSVDAEACSLPVRRCGGLPGELAGGYFVLMDWRSSLVNSEP